MNDYCFKALADGRRRTLLAALLEHNPQSPGDPAVAGGDTESLEYRRRQAAMHHNHLPMLDEYGFVTWDEETNEVSKGPQFEEIRPLLELVDDQAGD
ncbi:DUF7344 domain-containing protein [Halomicrococcus gelatinilyticus]|uniref:DUF7344 domain-containing protein n=1 Tax=Halomicrococcus gelatinilyticus TaxID=1702103 RepID=UPI002E13700F